MKELKSWAATSGISTDEDCLDRLFHLGMLVGYVLEFCM